MDKALKEDSSNNDEEKTQDLSPLMKYMGEDALLAISRSTEGAREPSTSKQEFYKSNSVPTGSVPALRPHANSLDGPTFKKNSLSQKSSSKRSSDSSSKWRLTKNVQQSSKSLTQPQENRERRSLKAVAQRVSRQIKARNLIKQWTRIGTFGAFATDDDHLEYMRDTARSSVISTPEYLMADLREEVIPILQDTLKQYKLELGAQHYLTFQLQVRITKLKEEANACSVRDPRRDASFFRRFSINL